MSKANQDAYGSEYTYKLHMKIIVNSPKFHEGK